jgi:hypothetical protein
MTLDYHLGRIAEVSLPSIWFAGIPVLVTLLIYRPNPSPIVNACAEVAAHGPLMDDSSGCGARPATKSDNLLDRLHTATGKTQGWRHGQQMRITDKPRDY